MKKSILLAALSGAFFASASFANVNSTANPHLVSVSNQSSFSVIFEYQLFNEKNGKTRISSYVTVPEGGSSSLKFPHTVGPNDLVGACTVGLSTGKKCTSFDSTISPSTFFPNSVIIACPGSDSIQLRTNNCLDEHK